MTSTLLFAASDVTVRQDTPDKNYAGYPYITLIEDTGLHRFGVIYFNLPFPRGVTVLSATLHLFQRGPANGGSRTLEARRLTASYKESQVNWTNIPGYGTTQGFSAAQGDSSVDGREWAIDVTDLMQEVSDGGVWYGFRIASNNATLFALHSREAANANLVPVLEVEYSDAPGQPSQLSPAAGRAVSIARPTLRWDFIDVSGNTNLESIQVQMNLGSADAVSPDVDSGEVSSTLPQYLVGFDITAAQVWYWRARNKDGSGLWSEWSDWVSFTRTAKPTVTITAPSGTVFEATPTFAWTVTGGTQTAYQLFICDGDDATEVLYTFDKVTSSSTSVQMPNQPIVLQLGGSYQAILRVWDTVSREGTPGDPVYTEQVEAFTFGLSNTVDPVDTITVTSAPGLPWFDVAITRSVAADSYTLFIDDEPVLAGIDPGDFPLRYYGADPGGTRVVAVGAVESGVTSDDNPTDTADLTVEGVWLVAANGSTAVNLRDDYTDPITIESAEVSAVHSPLGATSQVVRTQAVFGRTGRVTAALDAKGLQPTLAEAADAWKALVAARGDDMYLTAGDTSMRVVIFNTVRGILDEEFQDSIPVSFEYIELV